MASKPKKDIRVVELKARRDELLAIQLHRTLEEHEAEELKMLQGELYQMGEKEWE